MTTRAETLARARSLDLYEATRLLRERDEDQRRQARFAAADQLDRPPTHTTTANWTYGTSPACWTYGSFT